MLMQYSGPDERVKNTTANDKSIYFQLGNPLLGLF